MTLINRIRDGYLTRFRGASRRGKLVLLAAPLLFACCGLSFLSTLVSPPDEATPTAEVAAIAERAATLELVAADPTGEPLAATAESTDAPTGESTSPPVRAATAVASTAIPPTAPPAPAAPTEPPQPTAPPVAAPGDVVISSIRYNGDINPREPDEYAVITNRGAAVVNMSGWRLNAGEPDQNFNFPSIDLQPGASCRVYTNQVNADSCGGGTFGSDQAIWNNGGDCGYLYDATAAEVSRYCW